VPWLVLVPYLCGAGMVVIVLLLVLFSGIVPWSLALPGAIVFLCWHWCCCFSVVALALFFSVVGAAVCFLVLAPLLGSSFVVIGDVFTVVVVSIVLVVLLLLQQCLFLFLWQCHFLVLVVVSAVASLVLVAVASLVLAVVELVLFGSGIFGSLCSSGIFGSLQQSCVWFSAVVVCLVLCCDGVFGSLQWWHF